MLQIPNCHFLNSEVVVIRLLSLSWPTLVLVFFFFPSKKLAEQFLKYP